MPLTKIERIRKTLNGEPVDRPPISFWAHNFARENSAEELADETVRVFKLYDWDFIKIQSRASAFAEMWGNRYLPSTELAVGPTQLEHAVHSPADLGSLHPADPTSGALGEQIEALRLIRRAVGPDVPILQTVFAPSMVLTYLVNGVPNMLRYVREHPQETRHALNVLRETLSGYTQAALENGADGIFYAIKAAGADQMTRDEYAEFGLPYDRLVLDAAQGWLNMLHLCGDNIYFEVAQELPSPLINWAVREHGGRGNPTLNEGRGALWAQAKRAVIGGVSPKPEIRDMTPEQVAGEVRAAIQDTGGIGVMIGPGCSISPDTPEANLRAARQAVEVSG